MSHQLSLDTESDELVTISPFDTETEKEISTESGRETESVPFNKEVEWKVLQIIDETEEQRCRICLETVDIDNNQIISPCSCESFFHRPCLEQWINTRRPPRQNCEVCHTEYAYTRRQINFDWNKFCSDCSGISKKVFKWILILFGIFVFPTILISAGSPFYYYYECSENFFDYCIVLICINSIWALGEWITGFLMIKYGNLRFWPLIYLYILCSHIMGLPFIAIIRKNELHIGYLDSFTLLLGSAPAMVVSYCFYGCYHQYCTVERVLGNQ